MKVLYTKTFDRDIDAIRNNPDIKKRLLEVISTLKETDSLDKVHGIRGIEGYAGYYRLRIGDYRLGIKLAGETFDTAFKRVTETDMLVLIELIA